MRLPRRGIERLAQGLIDGRDGIDGDPDLESDAEDEEHDGREEGPYA